LDRINGMVHVAKQVATYPAEAGRRGRMILLILSEFFFVALVPFVVTIPICVHLRSSAVSLFRIRLRSVLSVSPRSFDHRAEVLVRGVAAALIAGGKNEAAAFGGIVNGLLDGSEDPNLQGLKRGLQMLS